MTFFLYYFFNSRLGLICFLQFFFMKRPHNFLSITYVYRKVFLTFLILKTSSDQLGRYHLSKMFLSFAILTLLLSVAILTLLGSLYLFNIVSIAIIVVIIIVIFIVYLFNLAVTCYKPASMKGLNIFRISFFSSYEITNIVVPNAKFSLWIRLLLLLLMLLMLVVMVPKNF